jgi:hypothetical protein
MDVRSRLLRYADELGHAGAVDVIAELEGAEAAVRAAASVVRDATSGTVGQAALNAASWRARASREWCSR